MKVRNGKGKYPGYHRISLPLTGGIGYDFKMEIMLSGQIQQWPISNRQR